MLISSPTIPEVVYERIKSDVTELAFNFFQDGVSLNVSTRTYKIRLKSSGIQVLDKPATTNAAGRVTFVLSTAEKLPLISSEYQLSLIEILSGGGERTIVTGTLRWSVPSGKTIGLVVAPDVSVNYIAATGSLMVALGVVDFGSSASGLSAAAAAGSAVLASENAGIAEDHADAAITAKNETNQIKADTNNLKLAVEQTAAVIDQKKVEVLAAAAAAQLAANNAELDKLPKGSYNVATNVPAITAVPNPEWPNGSYLDITPSAGVLAFAGENFIAGQAVNPGDRLKKVGNQWSYIKDSSAALTKANANESLILQKVNEVFNPTINVGWKYLAKGRGTAGSKLIMPDFVFDVSEIAWGGSAVNVTFKAKILIKSSNIASIVGHILQANSNSVPGFSGGYNNATGGSSSVTPNVVLDYSVTKSVNTAKLSFIHNFIQFDPINEDLDTEIWVYNPTLDIGGVPAFLAGSGLYLPNATDTFSELTASNQAAATMEFVNNKLTSLSTQSVISGHRFKAKGNQFGRVAPVFAFDLTNVDYASGDELIFSCKILVNTRNVVNISTAVFYFNGSSAISAPSGDSISTRGGRFVPFGVSTPYQVKSPIPFAKQNFVHCAINFDLIDDLLSTEIIIYDVAFTIKGLPGVRISGAALNYTVSGDTVSSISSLNDLPTFNDLSTKLAEAKSYTDSSLTYNQINTNFDLHLVNSQDWYKTETLPFIATETDAYLTSLGIKKSVKLNANQTVGSAGRRDIFFRQKFDSAIDGKYIQTVFYLKTDDPAKFANNVCFVSVGATNPAEQVPISSVVKNISSNLWEVRNTFRAPATGGFLEVWIGSSFMNGGTSNLAALTVSGFFCYVQSDPISGEVTTVLPPAVFKEIYRVQAIIASSLSPNKLTGKTVNMLGDSIVFGQGVVGNAYHDLVAKRNGMVNRNYGIAGTQLAGVTNVTYGLSMSNPTRYSAMASSADYVIVAGGTNDFNPANGPIPIGTDNDTTVETFKGALNLLCLAMIEKYPNSKIGFITPMNCRTVGTGLLYADAIITICAKYGIPVLDWYRNSGIYIFNSTQRTALMQDFVHPNAAGNQLLSESFEAFLRRI